MKTAISLPDEVFEAAEELAEELGVSRSHLYALALTEFVEQHRRDEVTERLDAIYGGSDSTLDPALADLQHRSLPPEEW